MNVSIDQVEFDLKIQNYDYRPCSKDNIINLKDMYIEGGIIDKDSLKLDEYISNQTMNSIPIIQ